MNQLYDHHEASSEHGLHSFIIIFKFIHSIFLMSQMASTEKTYKGNVLVVSLSGDVPFSLSPQHYLGTRVTDSVSQEGEINSRTGKAALGS